MESRDAFRVNKSQPQVPILSLLTQSTSPPTHYFFNIHFNIILPHTPSFFNVSLSVTFHAEGFITICYVTGVCYMSHPSQSLYFYDPNYIGSLFYLPNVANSCLLTYRINVRSAHTHSLTHNLTHTPTLTHKGPTNDSCQVKSRPLAYEDGTDNVPKRRLLNTTRRDQPKRLHATMHMFVWRRLN
jgi:hypothetical protein